MKKVCLIFILILSLLPIFAEENEKLILVNLVIPNGFGLPLKGQMI